MMRNETPNDRSEAIGIELSPRQSRFAELLLSGRPLVQVAKECRISRATAHRWARDPVIEAAVRHGQRRSLAALGLMLASLDERAVRTLDELMTDPSVPAGVRRAAANQVIERRLQVTSLAELEERISALEGHAKQAEQNDQPRWH